jgi:hypothetical protein
MGFLPIYYGFFGRFLMAQFTPFTEVFWRWFAGVFGGSIRKWRSGFFGGGFWRFFTNFDFAYKSTHWPLCTKYTLLYE